MRSTIPTFWGRAATPRLQVLQGIARAIDEILQARPGDEFDGYTVTGPGNLGMAVNLCLGRRRKAPHEWGRHERRGFRYRLFRKVPKRPGQSGQIVDNDTRILLTEYPEYRDDLQSTGETHWTALAAAAGAAVHRFLYRRAAEPCR